MRSRWQRLTPVFARRMDLQAGSFRATNLICETGDPRFVFSQGAYPLSTIPDFKRLSPGPELVSNSKEPGLPGDLSTRPIATRRSPDAQELKPVYTKTPGTRPPRRAESPKRKAMEVFASRRPA